MQGARTSVDESEGSEQLGSKRVPERVENALKRLCILSA